jgi:hypothetical protein
MRHVALYIGSDEYSQVLVNPRSDTRSYEYSSSRILVSHEYYLRVASILATRSIPWLEETADVQSGSFLAGDVIGKVLGLIRTVSSILHLKYAVADDACRSVNHHRPEENLSKRECLRPSS